MAERERRIFRFGVFEADVSSGELRKSGMRLRLQEQPFQVLLLLLERSGEVITREEIRQKLWPADTFVDFDHSLNTIINKIRDALNDSAANPRFVETLAKRGYRFLLPVDATGKEGSGTDALAAASAQTKKMVGNGGGLLTRPEDLPAVSQFYARALFLLIQLMYLIFYIVAPARISAVQALMDRAIEGSVWATVVVIVSACIGIPVRLYLFSAVAFNVQNLSRRFQTIFPGVLALDELWAISPFLLVRQIGPGLALAVTAALAYVPFAQRTLLLMQERSSHAVAG
jgi:cholera toxin transcriptional activator